MLARGLEDVNENVRSERRRKSHRLKRKVLEQPNVITLATVFLQRRPVKPA
jgi:hypothetical protein